MHPQTRETEIDSAKEVIRKMIIGSPHRLTPAGIRVALNRDFRIDKQTVSSAILELVTEKTLTFTHQFGCSFLELSFNKPVRVSGRIVLKPPNVSYLPSEEEIVINILSGAAFGSGEHPTTRLALRGIEQAFSKQILRSDSDSRMLDIGTGSGILAIAGVLMGIGNAVAADLDPCARVEAENNAKLNGLSEQIVISGALTEPLSDRFALITANLRTPTLKGLKPLLTGCLREEGVLVMSGIKRDEVSGIKKAYEGGRLFCRWEEIEKDWAGLVFY